MAGGITRTGMVFWKRFRKHKGAVLGLALLTTLLIGAILAPVLTPYSPTKMMPRQRLSPPSNQHWLGTDNLGRDLLCRILYGGRISLLVGFVAVGIGAVFGGIGGAVGGYFGSWVDTAIMRLMDVLMSVPQLILAVAMVAALGPGLINLMISVGISVLPRYARISRASALSLRETEFVEASRAAGCGHIRIIFQNILPNCMAPLIVYSTLGVAQAILSASTLSFLGLGIQPPSPEWGAMLSAGRDYLRTAPWIMIFPGIFIVVVVLSLNLVGDGLRDALDPKLKT